MRLLIFAASHRPDSLNRKLAQLAAQQARRMQAEIDIADYSEFDMPVYNDQDASEGVPDIAQSFAKRMHAADGVIIASPEYNWSLPGSLKNILDWTSRIAPNPVAGKTALLLSATPGVRGGIVGLQHLKLPLEALQLYVYPKVFPLGVAHQAFTDEGQLIDKTRAVFFESLIEQYIVFTRKLAG